MFKAHIQGKTFEVSGSDNNSVVNGIPLNADILEFSTDKFHIILDSKSYSCEIISMDKSEKSCIVKVGNNVILVKLEDQYDNLLHVMGFDSSSNKKVNNIIAPMPGMVLQILVEDGQAVSKGDSILVLEAMKMENVIKSPADGIVKKIQVNKGDKVEKNQVMVNLG